MIDNKNRKPLTRRDFIRLGAISGAGLIITGCGVNLASEATAVSEATATSGVTAATVTPGQVLVTLDIRATQPEYANAEKQIWAIWEQRTGNTVNLYAINDDQDDAYQARLAGGYVPALDRRTQITPANSANFVNFLDIDFKWFDKWEYDIRHAWENRYGQPGVYSLDFYQGFIFSWQYHKDLMEELGLDPRKSVKTFDDLKKLLADGTAAVAKHPDIDHFWDEAWHSWVYAQNYWGLIPLAYPDGQRDMQRKSWLGEITDPEKDPFRHTLNFFKEAYEEGWLPKEFWLREWETDMEAGYIAKKSVMMLHGPWTWDKMLAGDPSAMQEGIPATPPAAGQAEWVQGMGPLRIDAGLHMPIANLDKPEFDTVLDAWNFWHSPEIVKLRAEMEGRAVLYTTDEPVELEGPQWEGLVSEFLPSGFYNNVKIEAGLTGDEAVARFKIEDSGNYWDWQWTDLIADVCTGKRSVAEGLAWFHEQVARDYPQT